METHEGKFIYHCGRYWLVEKFDSQLYEGGFFAIPIHFDKYNKVQVIQGGANWCYKSNGAILKNPDKDVIVQAYKSQLEHLQWCKENQKKYGGNLLKINKIIKFYNKLLKEAQ